MSEMRRPGGKLASRPLHFFWIVDCSGSMYGDKIGTVNCAIREVIPEMKNAADNNPNAQLMVRALKFSTGASWITSAPVNIEEYAWDDDLPGTISMELHPNLWLGKSNDFKFQNIDR